MVLQNFIKVNEHEVSNTSDHMVFFDMNKALHNYPKNNAIRTLEAVLNLDKKEFNVLRWLFQQDSFPDIKRAYREHAQEDKFCYTETKQVTAQLEGTH